MCPCCGAQWQGRGRRRVQTPPLECPSRKGPGAQTHCPKWTQRGIEARRVHPSFSGHSLHWQGCGGVCAWGRAQCPHPHLLLQLQVHAQRQPHPRNAQRGGHGRSLAAPPGHSWTLCGTEVEGWWSEWGRTRPPREGSSGPYGGKGRRTWGSSRVLDPPCHWGLGMQRVPRSPSPSSNTYFPPQ